MNPWMLQELAAAQLQDACRRAEASRIGCEAQRRSRPAATGRTSVFRRMSQLMHPAAAAREPVPRGDGGRPARLHLPRGQLTRSADPSQGWRMMASPGDRERAASPAQPRR